MKGTMKVTMIGTGFVGVVTAAVFASFGNEVVGLDIDEKKVQSLSQGTVPFYEPGLEELLVKGLDAGNLSFTTDVATAVAEADIIMIAVGTPSDEEGHANLNYLYAACDSIGPHLKKDAIVVVKSTVPPGTLGSVSERIAGVTDTRFITASLPEFLKEGTAVDDTLHPDRVVIGVADDTAYAQLAELHKPLGGQIIRVSPESAQMGKYAANAYLALRIAFINQIADLCAHNGADVEEVISVIGPDKRIGPHYWYPGLGYGGSCFPKDVKELAYYSQTVGEGENLFVKLNQLNEARIPHVLEMMSDAVGGWAGKSVAVLGLSFKPNTNDTREAPALKVIPELLKAGASVHAYDPKAVAEAEAILDSHESLYFADSIAAATTDADVIILLIEWKELVEFDYSTVRNPEKKQWFIDTRNQLDPEKVTNWGYTYQGIGRSPVGKTA